MQNPSKAEIKEILQRSKRVAVVGLSDRPDRTSHMVSKAMQDAGYEIIPVNPTIDEALGVKAVSSLKEIDGPIDIVNVFRRSEQLPGVAEEFLETDAPVFWAQQGLVNEEAYQMLKEKGRTVIMDLCIKVAHAVGAELQKSL
ncbi:CoA-binding protein [Bacillus subtilis]|nr:CoA-binding protein [Bacillus subtilis]WEZ02163.1 CoA-binding protein [Bacillus subtilis]